MNSAVPSLPTHPQALQLRLTWPETHPIHPAHFPMSGTSAFDEINAMCFIDLMLLKNIVTTRTTRWGPKVD